MHKISSTIFQTTVDATVDSCFFLRQYAKMKDNFFSCIFKSSCNSFWFVMLSSCVRIEWGKSTVPTREFKVLSMWQLRREVDLQLCYLASSLSQNDSKFSAKEIFLISLRRGSYILRSHWVQIELTRANFTLRREFNVKITNVIWIRTFHKESIAIAYACNQLFAKGLPNAGKRKRQSGSVPF